MAINNSINRQIMLRPAVILLVAVGMLASSCHTAPPPPVLPTPVNLVTVRSTGVLYYDKYPATTEALSQVDIRSQVQGYVTAIYFSDGQHVRKGQKLYEIDSRLYQAAYEQAQANLKVSQGSQLQSKQDADRYQYLGSHNAVAKQLVDHANIALQNSNNEVAASEQAVKTAATNLTYSAITAPFDGTIGFSQVKLGNFVAAGTTTLNTVSTDKPMAVDFLINEKQLSRYEELARNDRHHVDSLFTVLMPDQSIYPETGKLSVIDRAVDPQTGTIRVRLVFQNPKLAMRAGMSCVVRVHNQESSPQMLIPGKAIVEQMGEYFVYIVKDSVAPEGNKQDAPGTTATTAGAGETKKSKTTSDSSATGGKSLRAYQVRVMTGQTIGANIIVMSGLEDGQQIVVDGVQALHDGSPVTTANKQGPASGGRGGGK